MQVFDQWLRRVIGLILLLVLVGGGGFWLVLRGSLAKLDGQANGQGLSALVTITRDGDGVPSILAQNRADVAFAMGVLHGQERFFQMDLMRRTAAGELSELVGPAALKIDRGHRFYRLRARAEAALRTLSHDDRLLIERYSDGVNAGLDNLLAVPPDYLMTMVAPKPWTPEDCLLVGWAMYFDLQNTLEPREWARGWIKDHVTQEQLEFLLPEATAWDAPLDGPSPAPAFTIPETAPDWWSKPKNEKASLLPDEFLYGSNNWALQGSRTQDGHAIVANDMHLGLRLPPTWYRMMYSFTDGGGIARKMIGVTLPGTPVTIVGSNSHVAWGFTNAAGDWLDLVRLDQDVNHPGQVRVGDEWVTPTLYAETINVKNGQPEKFLVKETALGPIEEFDGQIYAVHWLAQAPQAVDFGILKLESAATADDALQIGAAAGIPELNMIAGDDQGHIGWTIAGPMPARGKPGITATFPLEPEQADAGWQNLLPPSSHPRILDPKDGQLQTANSRTLMGEGSAQIGDGGFDLGARTRQIRDDLTALGNNIEVKSAYQVALDDRAIFMEGWRAKALALLDDSALKDHPDRAKFRKLLTESWDGHASVNSVGYRLARGFLDQLYGICFGALDEKLAALDRGADYVLATKRWPVVLDRLLTAQPVAWLPAGYADWRAVQLAAIDASITELTANGAKLEQASWGARNRAKISHPFARFLPSFVARYLSAPMDMLPGDSNLPRVAAPSMGASERFAVSPGKEEAGVFNLPGGQSGHPLSPFFLKGHEDWVLGVPTPLLPGAPKYGLVLTPS